MSGTRTEIQEVSATRVDESGRVRSVRVVGVCDQREYPVFVVFSPGTFALQGRVDLRIESPRANGPDGRGEFFSASGSIQADKEILSTLDSRVWRVARWVDRGDLGQPATHGVRWNDPGKPGQPPRPAYLWCAELDLDRTLELPVLMLGPQLCPWTATADLRRPGHKDEPSKFVVRELALVDGYQLGVLFVHGIGEQSRAETLVHWTAPLLRWLNAWFTDAGRQLADRADPTDATQWLCAQSIRPDWSAHDDDTGTRRRLAMDFAEQVLSRRRDDGANEVRDEALRTLSLFDLRELTPEELLARDRFALHVRDSLGASVVGGMAKLANARLIDGDAPASQPSTVEMHLTALEAQGQIKAQRWLMAESHWANSFRPPPFGAFGLWCLRTAPAIWVHYVALTVEHRGRPWWRAAWTFLPLATAVAVAMLLFSALLLIGMIPWQRLRDAIVSAQRLLAGVVGDSYVFIADEVQRRAVVDRVQRDVAWLAQRCSKVVVVAHSQGAAVADQALNTVDAQPPQEFAGLVTLGAGVQTLARLATLRQDASALGWGSTGLVGACGVWAAAALGGAGALGPGAAAALAIASLAALLLAGRRAWGLHPKLSRWSRSAGGGQDWHDLFATHDLVPWGPLCSPEAGPGHYKPREVDNRASFIADHVTYWSNSEQVVGPVALLLGRAAGAKMIEQAVPDAAALVELVAWGRRIRISWLQAGRWTSALCVAFLAWSQWASLATLSSWAWNWAAGKLGIVTDVADLPGWPVVGKALCILLPVVAYQAVISPLWDAWNGDETRCARRSGALTSRPGWPWVYGASLAALAVLCLSLSLAVPVIPAMLAWVASALLTGGVIHVMHEDRVAQARRRHTP